MMLVHTCRPEYLVKPVCISIMIRIGTVSKFLQGNFIVSSGIYFIFHQCPIVCIYIIGKHSLLNCIVTGIIDTNFTGLSLLCSNKYNTIGCTYTINSSRCSIFQYRDTFNISRRNIAHL